MKNRKNRTGQTKSVRRRARHEIGTAGCAIFLVATGGAALAQQPGAETSTDMEEVVVSGIRKSIQD